MIRILPQFVIDFTPIGFIILFQDDNKLREVDQI